jgi:rSAM/selenodomain-associated transferase 1
VSGALVVFAKQPLPGQVKTRLCPPFTAEQAADFYACMLEDVLETTLRASAALGLVAVLALQPPAAAAGPPASGDDLPGRPSRRPEFAAPAGLRCEPQQGADLGARMEHAFARELAAGHGPVLLRGSDSPTLRLETLSAALLALERSDLVICPDRDGGYNLVGLRRPAPGLFSHSMSTASVLVDTLARARGAGLTHALLPAGFDIDTAADLALLAEARRHGAAGECPRTLAFLDRHGLWPG